jgi:exopolysaccharide biosynthesis polyprenyl glycosylphosphotransferase
MEPEELAGTATRGRLLRRALFALFCLDLPALFLIPLAAMLLRFGGDPPFAHQLPLLTLAPLFTAWRLASAQWAGAYDFRHNLASTDLVFSALGAALLGAGGGYVLIAFLQLYHLPHWEYSRLTALLDFGLTFGWLAGSRVMALALLRARGLRLRVVLAGPASEACELERELRAYAPIPAEVETEPGGAASASRRLLAGGPAPLEAVILCDGGENQEALRRLLDACDRRGAECYLFPGVSLPILTNTRVASLAGLPLAPLTTLAAGGAYRFVKRVFDVAAALALLVLGAPWVALGAAAMRLSGPGRIFYVQERVGRGGQRFPLLKLRTMRPAAESGSGPVLADRDDPRIPAAGRWLRRYRIDEIPQLWNVLRGEMSLVGPRPERPHFVERYLEATPLYGRRFIMRPGLTGLAQIHGRYDTSYEHKLRYDLIYVNSASFLTDARILLATAQTVLTGRGAR